MIIPGIGASGIGAVVASGSGSGGGVGSVQLTDQSVAYATTGAPRTVAYRINTSGVVERGQNGVYNTLETWRLSGVSADYDVRLSAVTGAPGGSAINTWLNLGTSREWTLTDTTTGDGGFIADGTIKIRQAAAPNTVLATALVDLYVEAF